MKQFIIDLITANHSNHLGAGRVILSILPGKGAMKVFRSGKGKDGCDGADAVCVYSLIY